MAVNQRYRIQYRFWHHVDISNFDGCWLWKGADDGRFGHGKFKVAGVSVRAIRWLCELYAPGCLKTTRRGVDLVVRHTCDNPKCVRPDHLIVGTQKQNVGDAIARGRHKLPDNKKASDSQLSLL